MIRAIVTLFRETAVGYGRSKGSTLAAAIAYRALFSMAPLLVIAIAVAGWVFGERAVAGELAAQIETVVGQEAAVLVQSLISSASQGSTGLVATIISFGVLFFGATSLFSQIKIAINLLWDTVPPPVENGVKGILAVIWARVVAFLMAMLIGFLLLLTITLNAILATVDVYLSNVWDGFGGVSLLLNYGLLVGLTVVLFALIFKILPDAEVAWRDVGLGALVTAVLFALGEYLIGLYLGNTSAGSAYGAAGSLVVTLLWVYYSAQIFLFGAKFTQVYANLYGSKVRSLEGGTAVTDSVFWGNK
ncbi:MAG: YihY/virulence factor BrkB family protein [Chloroflexi bacterium]|nr:YihY/virulence factor BrkB family protein [Chloroflexota bacterium]